MSIFKTVEDKIADIRKRWDDFDYEKKRDELKQRWDELTRKYIPEKLITFISENWDNLKQIIEKLGGGVPFYIINFTDRRKEAEFDIAQGRLAIGVKKLFEIVELNDRMITRMCYLRNKRDVQECIRNLEDNYFRLISVIMQNSSELKEYIPKLSDVILRRKAIILEIGSAQRDNILLTNNPDLKAKLDHFRKCQMKIAESIMKWQKHQKEIDVSEQL